jgi:hypothetical protein
MPILKFNGHETEIMKVSKVHKAGIAASPAADLTLNYRQRNLISVMIAIAECKKLKPGIFPRRYLAALSASPILTPELVTKPGLGALLKRIGLTPEMLKSGRSAARITLTPEMDALTRLANLAKQTKLTPEIVMKTLRPGFEEQEKEKQITARIMSRRGKKAAAARHAPDNEKRNKIRANWATGKYPTKILCAEKEYAALGVALETAQKALRNEADPNPWPSKGKTTKAKV